MLNGYTAVEGKATTQENGKPSEKKRSSTSFSALSSLVFNHKNVMDKNMREFSLVLVCRRSFYTNLGSYIKRLINLVM
jgi:hypothetical protein